MVRKFRTLDCNSGHKNPGLRLLDVICDTDYKFKDDLRENLNSFSDRCSVVYNSVLAKF